MFYLTSYSQLHAPIPILSPPKNYSNNKKFSTNLTKSIFLYTVFLDMEKNSLSNLNCLFYVLIFCPLNHWLELDNYPLCSPSKTDCSRCHCLRMSCTWFLLHESTAVFIITAVTWRVCHFCLLERSRDYFPQPAHVVHLFFR